MGVIDSKTTERTSSACPAAAVRNRVRPAAVLDGRQREDLGDDGAEDQPVEHVADADAVPQQHPHDGDGEDGAGLPAAAAALGAKGHQRTPGGRTT